jgi:predicted unusual protein kinase regulating ubiquinone biosynthesis (AarF/ABC1/UbiB family)
MYRIVPLFIEARYNFNKITIMPLSLYVCDMTMPLSNTLQPPSHTTSTQVQSITSPTQAFDGPITRSRAKKLQQEVHALLYEFQLNTNENFMLPKSCMLILLRFTKEEGQRIKDESTRRAMSESVQRNRTVQKKQSYLLILKSYEGP